MKSPIASRWSLWMTGVMTALLIGGWVASSFLYRQFLRYGEVVQATNDISTAAFDISRAVIMALDGSPVAQRQVAGANHVLGRELERLEHLHWNLHDQRSMRDLQIAILETEKILAEPMSATRREFLSDTLHVHLARLTSATKLAHAATLYERDQAIRVFYLIHSATFAAALVALIVAVMGYARQQRERDRFDRSLQHMNEQLRTHAEEMEQIVYVASHDLKEPLRMVHAYTDIIEAQIGTTLSDKSRRHFDFVRKGAKRMQLLIDDLLRLAVLDREAKDVMEYPARAEVDEIVMLFRQPLEGSELTIGELPSLKVDRSRFSQILQNLVGNAIKYRDPARPLCIRINARSEESQWQFTIEDNGIGVPGEHREVIFGLFRRLHGPEIEGTGAGLAICKKIVEGWGGRIWAEPGVEHGTRICFTIPHSTVIASRATSTA